MLRSSTTLAVLGLAMVTGCGKQPTVVLLDLRGTGALAKTPAVAAPGSFRLEYSWDCSKQVSEGQKNAQGFSYYLFHAEDETIAAETPTRASKSVEGKGSVEYTRLGNYYLTISSPCDWRVKVLDTSKAPQASPSPS